MTATKHDKGKPKVDLVPPEVILSLAEVLTFGADKYDAHNWRSGGGMAWSRVYAACQRHLLAFWQGEDHDPESGLQHLSHALCCIAFLITYQIEGSGIDDRYKGDQNNGS